MELEERRRSLELERLEAETEKLWTESDRMKLSNNLDKIRIALAGGGTVAVVLSGLKVLGWIGSG